MEEKGGGESEESRRRKEAKARHIRTTNRMRRALQRQQPTRAREIRQHMEQRRVRRRAPIEALEVRGTAARPAQKHVDAIVCCARRQTTSALACLLFLL